MINQPKFDVFLAHHNEDKPQVKAIAKELKKHGLNPWLDEEQIAPGRPFQDVIQQAIPNVKSAAIFIGPRGLGEWQLEELRSLIKQCAKKGIPTIPVLLPGVNVVPENLLFLGERRFVHFLHQTNEPEALENLIWGITDITPKHKPDNRNLVFNLNLRSLAIIVIICFTTGVFSILAIKKYFPPAEELQFSLGEKILLKEYTNPNKEVGIQEFIKGHFDEAFSKFELSLEIEPSDPEALIYKNNAKAAQASHLKIAVSVPISKNPNVAQEILRGVAQAQNEVNQNNENGSNEALLQVEIADDNNDEKIAEKIANKLIKNSSILAVVGHNSSEVSLAAAPLYQKGGLVMITPTSDANTLSENYNNPIFHTMPPMGFVATYLANYTIKTAHKKNIAICFDSKAPASRSLKNIYKVAIESGGGKVVSTDCDFYKNFKPHTSWSNAIEKGADAILLLPSVDRISKAIDMAQTNRGRLTLLGSPTINTYQALDEGGSDIKEMVVAVPWNPTTGKGKSFADRAMELWGGPVNWRTAMAYDATVAIIRGLKKGGNTRDGLKKALSSKDFSFDGATGKIHFQEERETPLSLLKVQPSDVTDTGYDFVGFQP